jgi:hypothetical protein
MRERAKASLVILYRLICLSALLQSGMMVFVSAFLFDAGVLLITGIA